jgi:hypothetical protein
VEYRGFEFAVVRTIPRGWVWSVKRDQTDKGGNAHDREDAIKRAKQYIDNLLLRRRRAQLDGQSLLAYQLVESDERRKSQPGDGEKNHET